MQKQLHELLSREMTRQEFLVTIGVGLASVFGLSGLIKLLFTRQLETPHQSYANPYGGGKL